MRAFLFAMASVLLALPCAACSRQNSPPPQASSRSSSGEASRSSAPGPVGTIEARVTYAGRPVVEHISINKDVAVCGTTTPIEKIVVDGAGDLAEAVVAVVGLQGPARVEAPKLDQHGCQFRPHVLAIHTGELEVLNSDGILHNLHTYSSLNEQINKAQPKFKKEMTVSFDKPEVVKLTCDVHSWMQGWLVVEPNSYFGVTDAHGIARIEGVPAGARTVEVWQQQLGRRSKEVTVPAGGTVRVDFEYPKAG
jgi:hypothetical protein